MTPTFKTSAKIGVSLSESVKHVNNLQVISQQDVLGKDFKVYGDFENPLFLAKDVAEWIDHSDVSTMLKNVDDDEKLIQTLFVAGQNRQCAFLTENGLYEVLMLSRKPIAKDFKKEVKRILKEIRKTGKYVAPVAPVQSAEEMQFMRDKLEKERREVDLERARFLRSMSLSYSGKSETFPQILDAYAVHEIVGTFALPLPEIKQRLMSAGEVGKILGISSHKVGLLANKNGIKVTEYGSWVRDKSRYSAKEVDTFRYNEAGLEKLKELASHKGAENE